jgi:hypothetical protein
MTKHNESPDSPDSLESIDLGTLEVVTGGRVSRSSEPDPQIIAGIKQLGDLITQVGQGLVQAQAQGPQQMMQMMQQMMQMRGGR